MEDRTLLDAMVFSGIGTPAAPADWFDVANWTDLSGADHVPTAADDVAIPGGVGYVSIGGGGLAEVNSIVTAFGSTLIITGGSPQPSQLKIDSNPPTSGPPGFPLSPVPGSNYFGGAVIDAGLINLNSSGPGGTQAIFAGGTAIGPGDLNGSLDAGPNSSFTFAPPLGGGTPANTFLVGATLGPGSGSVIIAAPVTVAGALNDGSMAMSVVTGGTLGGGGSLDEFANFTWTGGTISLTGGVTMETSALPTTSGASGKTLATVLTNDSPLASLGGGGVLVLTTGGSIDNRLGTLKLSLPTIANFAGIGVTNEADGTIEGTAPAATPTTIMAPFTNDGLVSVDSGDALILSNTGPGVTPDTLDGVFQLMGNLTLLGSFTSVTGFMLDSGSGFLKIGNGTTTATLTMPAGVTETINGDLEVTSTGTLTGPGEILNSGWLQLDAGATTGFGSYQQTSTGTLALTVTSMGSFETLPSPLVVAGAAQLSGTLVLLDYTPVVGDTFTVVRAGAIEDHFDTIPDGMSETDGSTSVTVTQVRPPA